MSSASTPLRQVVKREVALAIMDKLGALYGVDLIDDRDKHNTAYRIVMAELRRLDLVPHPTRRNDMDSDLSLFEYATRNKLRFASLRGELTAEQLWDVPLRSADGFNLDVIARGVNKAFKDATEESFVQTTRTPAVARLEAALTVVKRVIEVRLADEAAAKRRAENKAEREKLLAILAEKQAGKLSELSEKELQKRIAALET